MGKLKGIGFVVVDDDVVLVPLQDKGLSLGVKLTLGVGSLAGILGFCYWFVNVSWWSGAF